MQVHLFLWSFTPQEKEANSSAYGRSDQLTKVSKFFRNQLLWLVWGLNFFSSCDFTVRAGAAAVETGEL